MQGKRAAKGTDAKERILITLLATCACLVLTFTGCTTDRGITNRRTISVSGTAVTRVAPDSIVWHLDISDFDKDVRAAKRSNDQRVKTILGLRKELGIQDGDLETGEVSIRREYERDERGHQGDFKHFAVSRAIMVRQRDFKSFDEFLEKFVAGAAPEFHVEFQSARMQEVRAETRLNALQIAKDKAAAMAKVVGAQLGEVLMIDEHLPTIVQRGGGGG